MRADARASAFRGLNAAFQPPEKPNACAMKTPALDRYRGQDPLNGYYWLVETGIPEGGSLGQAGE